jgi:hypothetical protein
MAARLLSMLVIGAAALMWSSLSWAQKYRPDEFLTLDLPSAVLSPRPLGPATSFTPGPLDVTLDRGHGSAQINAETVIEPKSAPASAVHFGRRSTAKTALHRRKLLEAQASDRRIQMWPCKSGGICNWKR